MADGIERTASANQPLARFGLHRSVLRCRLHGGAALRLTLLGVVFGWTFCFQRAHAGGPPVDRGTVLYHLPVEDAAIALHDFSRLSGIQLVFPVGAVRGVQTNAVEGLHTAADALRLLLAGTALEAVQDVDTGAWAVRRAPPPPTRKNANQRGSAVPLSPDVPLEMDAFTVRNRRDAGIQTQTIFRTDAEAPIYHQVITRKQIEGWGVTSIAELMTMVPGYSGEGIENLQSSVNLSLDRTGTTLTNGAFLKMRGFDSTRSSVLLNGRRLPINLDSHGSDLSRIPLAAVERVNVLPFSGSALYGDSVIGGAVDIVLRKDYVGHSLSWFYGATTDGGGEESAITAVEGITLGAGQTKATVILDYQHRNGLRMSDRNFLARAEAIHPLEDVWAKARVARELLSRNDERYIATASPSYPGVVMVDTPYMPLLTGKLVVNGGLGIPGDVNRPFAAIPAGQDGTNVTFSSFGSSANATVLERRNQRAMLRRPGETYSFTAQIEHTFVPEKLELYAELGYSRAIDRFAMVGSIDPVLLSAVSPLNPFGIFGGLPGLAVYQGNTRPGARPVRVFFDPVDLPDNSYHQVRSGARLVVGMKGMINERWDWTVDGSFDRTDTQTTIDSPNRPFNALMFRMEAAGFYNDPFLKIYNPLADHRAFPISKETIDRYFQYRSISISQADVYGINGRVYGTPFELPAGPLGVSARGEYRREVNRARSRTDDSAELTSLLGDFSTTPSATSDRSDSISIAGEIRVPLISSRWRPIPVDTAELDFGTRGFRTFERKIKVAQTAAFKISPVSWIGLRGSYSEGYMPPPVAARSGPIVTSNFVQGLFDPGSTDQHSQIYTVNYRSNPTLRPETSVSKVAGIILSPRFAGGISFTADYWSIDGRNGIRELLPQEILDHPELFANRVTRGVQYFHEFPLPAVTIDDQTINLAKTYSSGIDFSLNGHAYFSHYGAVDYSAAATWVRTYREQVFASAPPVDLLSRTGGDNRSFSEASPELPLRGRATLGWEKGSLRFGITANYTSSYVAQSIQSSYIPRSTLDDKGTFETVSSSTLWDLQLNYTSSRTSWGRGRTTWTLGARNVFDRAPSYRNDGVAFYSHFEDPRMRFIYLRVQQEW